ncbi:GntR family transcriptional regulator [Micrococcales bacterium 31B]|nr:GntR family transcriptional regulator [Micrococcales bacterium 31B]
MLFRIDTTAATPLYTQLAACIRNSVATGEASLGERLPSARDLADQLGINLHTVLRAYGELRDEGILEVRRGRGAVITGGARRHDDLDAALDHAISLARQHHVQPRYLLDRISRAFP